MDYDDLIKDDPEIVEGLYYDPMYVLRLLYADRSALTASVHGLY